MELGEVQLAQAAEGVCQQARRKRRVVTIDDYQDVPPNDEHALMKAVANQPVSVAIEADQVCMQHAAAHAQDMTLRSAAQPSGDSQVPPT